MKKILSLLLILTLAFNITGCGKDESANNGNNQSASSKNEKDQQDSQESSDTSYQTIEIEAFLSEDYTTLKNHDSEVFYTNDIIVKYDVDDEYVTDSKTTYGGLIVEYFPHSEESRHLHVSIQKGDTVTTDAKSRCEFSHEISIDRSFTESVSDIKTEQYGDFEVYYYSSYQNLDDINALLPNFKEIAVYFDIEDNYYIHILYATGSKDIDIDVNELEEIIKSFTAEKVK